MRIMLQEYTKGGRCAIEMSEDGREFLRVWGGPWQAGAPVRAFIDVGCDDTEEGRDRLLKSMSWLIEEIKKRRREATAHQTNGVNVSG